MNDRIEQAIRDALSAKFSTEHLKNASETELQNFITSLQDSVEPETLHRESNNRIHSTKYFFQHNHDFGNFRINGVMHDRHIAIMICFIRDLGLPMDLSGKRVLDVGAWTGGTSMVLSALGAEVVAIEEVPLYADTVNYLANAFGDDGLRCRSISLYDFDDQDAYDYVIYPGIIYQVSDPILSLRLLFNALKDGGEMFVESYGVPAARGQALALAEMTEVAHSGTKDNLDRGGRCHFVPSPAALELWMRAVGFEDLQVDPVTPNGHLFAKGRRRQHQDMLRAGLSRPDVR